MANVVANKCPNSFLAGLGLLGAGILSVGILLEQPLALKVADWVLGGGALGSASFMGVLKVDLFFKKRNIQQGSADNRTLYVPLPPSYRKGEPNRTEIEGAFKKCQNNPRLEVNLDIHVGHQKLSRTLTLGDYEHRLDRGLGDSDL